MANVKDWVEGARLRTLPASVAPVLAGGGIAAWAGTGSWVRTLLAAAVALLFQIGVNFSNDYSDGIRGTDDVRSGPQRLTGSGLAQPRTVKLAAFACFALGCVAGLALVIVSGAWWLIAAGALAVVAAWYYTGGKHPYGYMGLGEIFVFVFFGIMATAGTVYTQGLSLPWQTWIAASGVGLIACALLMVNNIRDIPTDTESGKNTLAVRLGERGARRTYVVMVAAPFLLLTSLITTLTPWTFLIFAPAAIIASKCIEAVSSGKVGRELIPTLRDTGFLELAYAIALCASFVVSAHA